MCFGRLRLKPVGGLAENGILEKMPGSSKFGCSWTRRRDRYEVERATIFEELPGGGSDRPLANQRENPYRLGEHSRTAYFLLGAVFPGKFQSSLGEK